MSRPLRPLVALLVAAALLGGVFARVDLRADMADLLPQGVSLSQRLVLDTLREGAAATLVLIGIEGAPEPELARLARDLAARLAASGAFRLVADGSAGADPAALEPLFRYRYLLAPVPPEAFAAPGLHAALPGLLAGLGSSAAPLVKRYGLADPPGVFRTVLAAWAGEGRLRRSHGAWFAPDRPAGQPRALLLAQTAGGGLDSGGAALATIRTAFAALSHGTALGTPRLLLAGPPVFAAEAAAAMRADAHRLTLISALSVLALLLWRFRSPAVLAVVLIPLLASLAAAALAVQLAFGFVHVVTLGFGMTMLGVTVDYPVLLIGHRKQGEAQAGTLRRIGPAFALAVLCAALGLTSMLGSAFPGLAQLGLFALTGVVTAAAVTRFALAPLIVAAGLAPVPLRAPERLLRIERLRRGRLWALVPVGAALGLLAGPHGLKLETDLARLSPVPPAALALDAELRAELGAPDMGEILLVPGPDLDSVLAAEEALMPRIAGLEAAGRIAPVALAARLLPSQATQRARQAALPDAATLAAAVSGAIAGTPFRAAAFAPFEADVAASRALVPLQPQDLNPFLAARLAPLVLKVGGSRAGGSSEGERWFGVIAPASAADGAVLADALGATPGGPSGLMRLAVKATADALLAAYTAQAWRWLAGGGLAVLAALALFLRDPARVAGVLGAIAAAILLTLAVLAAAGVRLTLFHLVALQLMAGVGLDYALFFARRQLDAEERARTLSTLALCNAMTLATFGVLALSRTPVLRGIGATVTVGALAAMVFAFLFAGERPATISLSERTQDDPWPR